MEIDQWPVLNGQLSILSYDRYNTWCEPDAAICSPVNDHVTIESLTAENWQYADGMEAVLNLKGFEGVQSDAVMYTVPVEQQVNEFLPIAFEEGCLSDWPLQQILPLLQTANESHSIGGPTFEMQAYAVQSCPDQKQSSVRLSLPAQLPVMPEMGFEGMASSDISMSAYSEDGNVMDLLTQLCDTVDGDMIMDQAGLAASYSSLPLMSPEDIDSLLSSDSWSSNAHVSTTISSFGMVLQSPNSPASDCESVSSSESSLFLPPVEKKQRKKEQNKTAALRYRQKKRSQQGSVTTECEDLEKRNTELKTKVSEMMKEIAYLKGLIDEINA